MATAFFLGNSSFPTKTISSSANPPPTLPSKIFRTPGRGGAAGAGQGVGRPLFAGESGLGEIPPQRPLPRGARAPAQRDRLRTRTAPSCTDPSEEAGRRQAPRDEAVISYTHVLSV